MQYDRVIQLAIGMIMLSVCLFIRLWHCTVAKRYFLQQKCRNKWVGSFASQEYSFTTFNPYTDPVHPKQCCIDRMEVVCKNQKASKQTSILPFETVNKQVRSAISHQQLDFLLVSSNDDSLCLVQDDGMYMYVMTNKRECQKGVSSRWGGSNAETVRSKVYVDLKNQIFEQIKMDGWNQQQIGVGGV